MTWKFLTLGFGFTLLPHFVLDHENLPTKRIDMVMTILFNIFVNVCEKIENFLYTTKNYVSTWNNKNNSRKRKSSLLEKFRLITPTNEVDKILYKHGVNHTRKGYVEFGKDKVVMPLSYVRIAEEIENFEVKDTDVWIVTHPKTGTTWTQEMMWMILNNLDYKGAQKKIHDRFTFLEFEGLFDLPLQRFFKKLARVVHPKYLPGVVATIDRARYDERKIRLIKTHLPWCLLPKAIRNQTTKAKIVYVIRNPKDTCASFYYHQRLLDGFTGSFDDFCKLFLAGRVYYGPYWSTVLDFWKRRNHPNICMIKFEEMKNDLVPVIREVSQFLIGRQLTNQQISDLVVHLSFDNMKNNPAVNYEGIINTLKLWRPERKGTFMRCGKVGSYRNDMSPEMEKLFDQWIDDNTEGFDMNFFKIVKN